MRRKWLAVGLLSSTSAFCVWRISSLNHCSNDLCDKGQIEPPPAINSSPQPYAKVEIPKSEITAADESAMQQIYRPFATGDFVGALTLAENMALSPNLSLALRQWLNTQMPSLLVSAGWAKLKLGDCDQALSWLKRAEELDHSHAAIKGLAVCYYKQKNMVLAREAFLNYLGAEPSDSEMQLLYTDVLESEGRFVDAVQILRQLLKSAETPGSTLDKTSLAERLSSMQSREQESNLEQTEVSRNFRLTFRIGDHEDLVSFVLSTLEEAVDEFHDYFGLPIPQNPIEVVIYPKSTFQNVTDGGPTWADGLFDGRIRIPVPERIAPSDISEWANVLRHELVHALFAVMNDSRKLPAWFAEGMAQRLACNNRSCGAYQFPPQPGGFLPLEAFNASFLSLSAVNAGRAYQQSLFLVLTLESVKGEHPLRLIITSLTTNSDTSSDALVAPLGVKFDYVYRIASDYWQRRQPPTSR